MKVACRQARAGSASCSAFVVDLDAGQVDVGGEAAKRPDQEMEKKGEPSRPGERMPRRGTPS